MSRGQDNQWVYYMAQIGHELRTPLNIIKGFGDLLHSETPGPLNDQQKRYMEKILGGADDLLLIIDDILEWARISTDQLHLEKEEVSLKDMILELQDFFRLGFAKAGLQASYDVNDLPPLAIDRYRIKQAMINILGNAIKYVPSGGQVFVTCRGQGSWAEIAIRDNGPGLSQEDIDRVTEPFRRGSQSIYGAQGTGLGLWISGAILQAHGGKLLVDNAPEGGAVFTLLLPMEEA